MIRDKIEELIRSSLLYRYIIGDKNNSEYQPHSHTFDSVLHQVYDYPETFSIEGYEEDYSNQEIEFLKSAKKELLNKGYKDIKNNNKYNIDELNKRGYQELIDDIGEQHE